ncbi:murein biosynthesis integral membrane protein MurJ [bacterium]|nr:murein biosynthesis integral membrane protein MurJ [bacterium]|tara:strand:- start:9750 stop:11429 length:1680 start_codon:yes stop_codon:yes gene_type:complete
MVNGIVRLFNKDFGGLHEAAFLLGISAFGSQILALVRDRLFASTFGAGTTLDVYYASFRVPDIIYVLVASLVAATVLIPFITEKLGEERRQELNNFLSSILTFFLLLMIIVSLVAYVLMPTLADIVVPGFSDENKETFIELSRLLLLSPFLLGLSNLFGSVVQTMRRFFVYALTPIVYNLAIIFGLLFLYEPFGIKGLVYGVILGALFHFIIQIPTVVRSGIFPRITFVPDFSSIKKVVTLSLPRTLTLSVNHILIIVFVALASRIEEGSIAIFNLSYNLQSVPLAIIGMSYSVAAFPTLSRLFSNGDKSHFVQYIVAAGKHIIFWSLPVLSLFVVLRAQIVRTILGAGEFTWTDTRLTAAALALFSFSVVAQGLINLFVRGYYAAGNTKKPLYVNLVSGLVSVVLGFVFLSIFSSVPGFRDFFENLFRVEGIPGTSVLMLPLAFSVGALLNLSLIWLLFKKEFREYYVSIRKSVFQSLAAALLMGIVAYYLLQVFDDVFDINTFWGIFLQGFLSGIAGIVVGILFLETLGNQEIKDIRRALVARVSKTRPVLPDQEEL